MKANAEWNLKPAAQPRWKQVLRVLLSNCMKHNVSRNAAALAYYLLFALFPLMIFVSNLLGRLNLDVVLITQELTKVLPKDIVALFSSYLEYVSQNSNGALMGFSLVFTIWFPMRAAGGLMDDVRTAYQLSKAKSPILYLVKQLIFTMVLLLVIALTLILSILGQRIVEIIIGWFPAAVTMNISGLLLETWHYFRFVLAGVIMLLTLGTLYILPQDEWQSFRKIFPGTIIALAGWLTVSIVFSYYVNNFANYSVIYGTLGAVIALLSWLYITSIMLILGAEINAVLNDVRGE